MSKTYRRVISEKKTARVVRRMSALALSCEVCTVRLPAAHDFVRDGGICRLCLRKGTA